MDQKYVVVGGETWVDGKPMKEKWKENVRFPLFGSQQKGPKGEEMRASGYFPLGHTKNQPPNLVGKQRGNVDNLCQMI